MADRSVHYEAAFEAFLRDKGIPYVAVDEAKKALFADSKLKSFDFVVYSKSGANLLVDVKGRSRRTTAAGKSAGTSFQTWATQQDVDDLMQWQQVFGEGFKALLAFVYWIDAPLLPEPGMFEFDDRWYLLLAVDLEAYRQHMRQRSPKWETVSLKADDFRTLARPVSEWL